ncbi:MAG TPA: 16S rRNA (cytosine(1402)-N(4))-methyltransferase RsmH [Pyrinomonadaceae bacterium]|nr:16S rRNA (cytosine(1402)-N(4))-methyltransferase RsmH [Chloracidobacterium sp.]HQX57069.1 16S rRNA (cytosine(1402)-N(4))-methyltransferase RsmH [Pyrinomonadaceae bacterium]MBK7802817.1 16S rRNA (cytosine(1402)-N(4))-methyltransferase RsmH [Chloracidobacterium sp.]MBK9439722.1 16S rRNA (cytosine(1402)-N(4))-methyltransferase RsmH [Chloracidobacterium sp.]MBK9768459.1 16S rRNA (cytosine(1402)-N(4))-methyltransferase RsmH [Chloracidobacterium sp.]
MHTDDTEFSHSSVLLQETLDVIDAGARNTVVDATLGLGGHTEAILDCSPNVSVLGIDQDDAAIKIATARLERFGSRINIAKGNFSEIAEIVRSSDIGRPDAIIADLGVSSLQFDDAARGFSFRFDAPLDMRMDPASGGQTVAELLLETNETDIANIIYEYGEERFSRRIARRIIERNQRGEPVTTTRELAELVARSVKRSPKDKIHPATRTFQALRIAVNRELEVLERFITDAADVLAENGVLAIITFHSLEDRIVKHAFQKLSGKCTCPPRIPQCVCGAKKRVEILTRKPIVPGEPELNENARSRSAKLRAFRKLEPVD